MVVGDDVGATIECDKTCKGVEVPTGDELTALNAMRTIKDRVRVLKKKLSETASPDGDESNEKTSAMEKELARLKAEWQEWEGKREEAARVRMILLGHEEN